MAAAAAAAAAASARYPGTSSSSSTGSKLVAGNNFGVTIPLNNGNGQAENRSEEAMNDDDGDEDQDDNEGSCSDKVGSGRHSSPPLTVDVDDQDGSNGENGLKKPRRRRTAFTQSQLNYLEKRFNTQKYLSVADRGEVAECLNLSETQIKTWYQNRR